TEGGDVVGNAGRSVAQRCTNGDGVGMLGEGLGKLLRLHRFAARRYNAYDFYAKRLAKAPPALAEAPGDEADGLTSGRHAIDNSRLHAAGAGSGERKDGIAGTENILEILQNLGQNLASFSRAMKRNWTGK